jgi:hypothetical protein
METLYPLVELGDVALSFTYPSRTFLIDIVRPITVS